MIQPKKGHYLDILLRSPKTIFSIKDVALIWRQEANNAVRVRLNSYVHSGKLLRIHRGIYAKDKNYNRFELATRIYTPSYISFETVLTHAGINFQLYTNIFVASYVTREINIDGQKISLVRMKDYILRSTAGIIHENGIATASKERAFLDRICISKDYHFDHLGGLDWDQVFKLLPIYHSKRMNKKVKEYFTHFSHTKHTEI